MSVPVNSWYISCEQVVLGRARERYGVRCPENRTPTTKEAVTLEVTASFSFRSQALRRSLHKNSVCPPLTQARFPTVPTSEQGDKHMPLIFEIVWVGLALPGDRNGHPTETA